MVMAALEDGGMEHDHFLNTNTGQVTTLSENFMEADEYAEEMAIVEESKVHVRIEPLGSRVAYQWMADFSETLIKQEDPILYGKLQVALNGIGAIFYV